MASITCEPDMLVFTQGWSEFMQSAPETHFPALVVGWNIFWDFGVSYYTAACLAKKLVRNTCASRSRASVMEMPITILIVDDEEIVRKVIRVALKTVDV